TVTGHLTAPRAPPRPATEFRYAGKVGNMYTPGRRLDCRRSIRMSSTTVPLPDLDATRVLCLDVTGRILDWISWQDAACLYVRDAVAWTLGEPCLAVHGGIHRDSGKQSVLRLHPIVASSGHCHGRAAN